MYVVIKVSEIHAELKNIHYKLPHVNSVDPVRQQPFFT